MFNLFAEDFNLVDVWRREHENVDYLRHDAEFCIFIKEKIKEFKEIHSQSEQNPNIIWDTFKCYITGFCIEYSSRKKKERNRTKDKLLKQISELKQKLSQSQKENNEINKSQELFVELISLEKDLNEILDKETAGLIVRSRIKWAEHGEKSSKYFCNLEKRNNEKKTIRQLKLDNGEIKVATDKILKELHSYFELLYSSNCSNDDIATASQFLSGLDIPKLSQNDMSLLNTPVTKAEIWLTLKSMAIKKTPGLDGLPVEFYIVFFNDIVDMLLKSY